ncbi:WcaF family extracellular polysaccharide biosynthesis acetyltransferase [Ancylobacter pratisalsi]|uniref:Colanic acid biosynthesis acetyltransferase WcaF n=1 Tax=Ancylobacter pratisalsi TaxID=1745854 RepID=A0A6P1YLS6_9HYPH|nr:WcaF family extracellular polysaccharide biosynthesis acetyltransferase [Ancylobacter pratisalsi]QIB34269.1 colanic acid biosynthesis acetyltransferase WcaF [Ancylobacter pratisalsi]
MSPPKDHLYQDLASFRVPPGFRGRSGVIVLLWQLTQATLFRLSPQPAYGWRRFLLRLFGAQVGVGVLIRSTARVTYPWKVILEDRCWIGDDVEIYSLGPIQIGHDAVVSQRSYLCAGSHDYKDMSFPLITKPIIIEPEAWIATGCFVAPGVRVGRGAIVAATSTVTTDVPAAMIVAGTPAVPLKSRPPAQRADNSTLAEGRIRVDIIGQLPPPVHGFSFITACVVDVLKTREDIAVTTFNIAKPPDRSGLKGALSRVTRSLGAAAAVLRGPRTQDRVCYIACDGGLGLVFTILFLAAARFAGRRAILHHHSFNYITTKRLLMRIVVGLGGRSLRHVFLCESMRDMFIARYGAGITSTIVSNAAFLPPPTDIPGRRDSDGTLVLGHLSNLSREKGLYLFLDLLETLAGQGVPVRGILAGPVAAEADRARIEQARAVLGTRLDYRGPLYGPQKRDFYEEIDVFIFPTTYENEAQPVVLFEAQAAGNLIVAYGRGCIGRQVGAYGCVIAEAADFIGTASLWLTDRANGIGQPDTRAEVRRFYAEQHAASKKDALSIIDA